MDQYRGTCNLSIFNLYNHTHEQLLKNEFEEHTVYSRCDVTYTVFSSFWVCIVTYVTYDMWQNVRTLKCWVFGNVVDLRYEEIMEAHESEMYRMEREAQKINNEQEKLKQDKLNELRNKFESDINEAIQREQEQVNIL